MKKNIVIFGAGKSGREVLDNLDQDKISILFFLDNNKELHGKYINKVLINPPEKLYENFFDYIIIASQYTREITQQLLNMGIDKRKILTIDSYESDNNLLDSFFISSKFKKESRNKIALINFNNSQYQAKVLYENIPTIIQKKFDISLINDKNMSYSNYDIIISSSLNGIYFPGKLNYEMWHGFPIKQIGTILDDSREIEKSFPFRVSKYISKIFSYSRTFNYIFNASFFCDYNNFVITGNPRNDYLFDPFAKKKLQNFLQTNLKEKKVLFYLPTWRKSGIQSTGKDNLLIDIQTDFKDFELFLEQNDIVLVMKYHDLELYKKYKNNHNIYFITDEDLLKENIHLYELLGACDILITDYSSVYFDTLLIDIPIIFYVPDYNEYNKNKGFWINNPELLMPGPKTFNIKELKKEVSQYFSGEDNYIEHRRKVKDFVHYYQDNKSTQRVWNEIIKDLEEKNIL